MILVGDVTERLAAMESESVQTCITSPPYWGLRDYGMDGQLGLEATPDEYVSAMVAVFADVRRVLSKDGTLWLNLGDSYASDPKKGGSGTPNGRNGRGEDYARGKRIERGSGGWGHGNNAAPGLKPKDLVGIPWRVAFALQADGWYLRSDIIWHKPNPMPESVRDRPTKSHEYLFLLSRSERYFYDHEAIKEPAKWERWGDQTVKKEQPGTVSWIKPKAKNELTGDRRDASESDGSAPKMKNKRDVWTIATRGYKGAHFAVMPEALVEPCVLAGSRSGDVVLDPFAGAGTTLVVAKRHRRVPLGIELNPDYAALAIGRLEGVAA